MSGFVSAIRRLAGNELLQDVCALVAVSSFIFMVTYGAAGLAMVVTAWRLGQ